MVKKAIAKELLDLTLSQMRSYGTKTKISPNQVINSNFHLIIDLHFHSYVPRFSYPYALHFHLYIVLLIV